MTDRLTLLDLAAAPGPYVARTAAIHDAPLVVGGTFVVGRAAYAVALAALGRVVAGGPHPGLDPARVAVTYTAAGRFADVLLPAGAAGSGPGREYLRAFGPVVTAVRAVVRIGRRGLWGMVADAVGAAGNQLGPAGRTAADAVLDELAPPGTTRPSWVPVERDGTTEVHLRRGMCCLAFRIEDHGYCASCPSVPIAGSTGGAGPPGRSVTA